MITLLVASLLYRFKERPRGIMNDTEKHTQTDVHAYRQVGRRRERDAERARCRERERERGVKITLPHHTISRHRAPPPFPTISLHVHFASDAAGASRLIAPQDYDAEDLWEGVDVNADSDATMQGRVPPSPDFTLASNVAGTAAETRVSPVYRLLISSHCSFTR